MSKRIASNEWGVIEEQGGSLELRWLPETASMTDGGFMATLCLFVWEAERARPAALLIDATEFKHKPGEGVLAWRDAHIVPRYGAAGVRKFAFVMPVGFGNVGKEAVDAPAVFRSKWFANRDEARAWIQAK